MTRARLLPLLPLLILAAAIASGCGSSSSQPSGSGGGQSGESSATTTTVPAQGAPAGAAAESCGETTVAGTEQLRVSGISCAVGRGIVASWFNTSSCAGSSDASRTSCSVYSGYRCLAARTDAGLAVSCARTGRSVFFIARRG